MTMAGTPHDSSVPREATATSAPAVTRYAAVAATEASGHTTYSRMPPRLPRTAVASASR